MKRFLNSLGNHTAQHLAPLSSAAKVMRAAPRAQQHLSCPPAAMASQASLAWTAKRFSSSTGGSPDVMSKDLYKRLGVSRDASEDEIKKAYKNLVRQYHPDTAADKEGATEKFQKIQEAYDTLRNPANRRFYNMTGRGTSDSNFRTGRVLDVRLLLALVLLLVGEWFYELYKAKKYTGSTHIGRFLLWVVIMLTPLGWYRPLLLTIIFRDYVHDAIRLHERREALLNDVTFVATIPNEKAPQALLRFDNLVKEALPSCSLEVSAIPNAGGAKVPLLKVEAGKMETTSVNLPRNPRSPTTYEVVLNLKSGAYDGEDVVRKSVIVV